jgi:hypothetical protein
LVPAGSIEEAAENAKNFALDKWKLSEGWFGHQASIMSVTKSFYDAAFNAKQAGIVDVDDENEEGQVFRFSPNPQDAPDGSETNSQYIF